MGQLIMNGIQLINKLTNKILHRDFEFSKDIPTGYLVRICLERSAMLFRGFFLRGLKSRRGKLFIGKKVKIYCKSKISVGHCVSLQDGVLLNALSKDGVVLEDNVSIGMRSTIKVSGSLMAVGKGFRMGHDSSMANDCFVGAAGGVEIGSYVAIGQNVRFHSENHEFRDRSKKICEQGVSNKGIKIGDDCWIGAGAVILDGVTIGNGCVIGANTLVNKNVPDYSIAAGNPVRIIGERGISNKE